MGLSFRRDKTQVNGKLLDTQKVTFHVLFCETQIVGGFYFMHMSQLYKIHFHPAICDDDPLTMQTI